jgi:hypothetical protein
MLRALLETMRLIPRKSELQPFSEKKMVKGPDVSKPTSTYDPEKAHTRARDDFLSLALVRVVILNQPPLA